MKPAATITRFFFQRKWLESLSTSFLSEVNINITSLFEQYSKKKYETHFYAVYLVCYDEYCTSLQLRLLYILKQMLSMFTWLLLSKWIWSGLLNHNFSNQSFFLWSQWFHIENSEVNQRALLENFLLRRTYLSLL